MLKRKKKYQRSLLCVDIGTSSIKACVFSEEEGHLELAGQSLVPQQTGNIQAGAIVNLVQTIGNVQEAVRKAENMARFSPEDMILGVSGELVKGITITLKKERNAPEKRIDAQELKTIIYELQWQAFEQIRKQISDEMSLPEMELKLVNASIVNIRVDGEEVDDPRGSSGKQVEMDIFNCFSPLHHFGHLQSIAVELPYHQLKGVFIQSFAVCHSLALQNTLESAIVVDIGAGTTDLCIIADGKIIGNRSFALGGDTLTKRISYELSTAFEEAESVKLNYCDDILEKRSSAVIEEALEPDIDIWMSSVDFCLKELPIKKLPHKILLCGKASLMPAFKEALQNHDWKNNFPIERKVQVRQLDYKDVLQGEFDGQDFELDYLPLMAVANTAHDLLYNNSSVESILSSIIAEK